MVREVSRRGTDTLTRTFVQWQTLTDEKKQLEPRVAKLRKQLMEHNTAHGEPDDKGHIWLHFDPPISVGGRTYRGIKNEMRQSTVLDEDKAEEVLSAKGLLDRAVKTIKVLDQDEIYLLFQEGELSEEEIDNMFTTTTSYAFKPDVA